jgi:hypothetical protein
MLKSLPTFALITGAICVKCWDSRHLLYILSSSDDEKKEGINITQIVLRDAFMEILYASYYLNTSDQNINKEGFITISDAADAVDVYRLSYPREISLHHQVQQTVLEHIKEIN